jgi:phage-related protein
VTDSEGSPGRREIGDHLSLVQAGRSASDWRAIPLVGTGVIEIRVHADGEYRVFYVAKFEDAVYVLHVFARKTRKASSLDMELGKKRYRELSERQSDASDKRQ